MIWSLWCCFSIVLNLFLIFTEVNSNTPRLIIQNIIPKKINPNLIKIEIKTSDGTILYQLQLQKTRGILANSQTPILNYYDDFKNVERLIKFYPDHKVMQGIGKFSFYHDIDNKASAVLFSDSDGLYLDGIIGDSFRLRKFPVNYLNNVIEEPGPNIQRLNENDVSALNKAVQNADVSYPELLVVLDYSLIANISKIDAIKTQLVYWNAVDMLFASMKSPEIYLNIAGFVLPSDQNSFPFLTYDSESRYVDIFDAIEGIENIFYKYRDQIPFDYDMLIAMTRGKLCVMPTTANPVMNCINGYSEGRPDTVNKFDDEHEGVESSAILHFDNQISSYTNAAQKIGYMFTGEFTQKREMKKCPGIMEEYYRRRKFSLSWSTCTQRKVSEYLQSPKAAGLKNFPKYLQQEKEVQLSTTESPQSSGWFSSLGKWLFSEKKDNTVGKTNTIITTEPPLTETITSMTTTEAYSAEVTEDVSQNIDSDKLSQDLTTSQALFEEMNSITTTEIPPSPEISEEIIENNEANVDLQQNFTSENDLEYLKDDINTMTLNPNQYSSTSPPLDSFHEEENKIKSLNIESRFLEEQTSTLEPVTYHSRLESEDISSTTVKTSTERHQVREHEFIFVDVTDRSEELDDTMVDNQKSETESSLVESTTNFESNQQNLSAVDSVVGNQINRQGRELWITEASNYPDEREVDEVTSNWNTTSEESRNSFEDQMQGDQPVLSDEQVEPEAMNASTTTSVPLLVTMLNRAAELNDDSTELVEDNSTELVQNNSTSVVLISSTESTVSSPAPLTCKREKMNVDVTLQLNINTNDKNIETLKRQFNSSSLYDKNENATYSNDKEKVIKNIIDLILETSDNN